MAADKDKRPTSEKAAAVEEHYLLVRLPLVVSHIWVQIPALVHLVGLGITTIMRMVIVAVTVEATVRVETRRTLAMMEDVLHTEALEAVAALG